MNESTFFTILSVIGIISTFSIYPPLSAIIFISLIALIVGFGEDFVSGRGHYTYKKVKPFKSNIPLYIIPFWIGIITLLNTGSALLVMEMGMDPSGGGVLWSAFFTGGACFLLDLILIEPIMCKRLEYWKWHEKKTILSKFNKKNGFTAPLGNYFTWFLFPFLASCIFFWI